VSQELAAHGENNRGRGRPKGGSDTWCRSTSSAAGLSSRCPTLRCGLTRVRVETKPNRRRVQVFFWFHSRFAGRGIESPSSKENAGHRCASSPAPLPNPPASASFALHPTFTFPAEKSGPVCGAMPTHVECSFGFSFQKSTCRSIDRSWRF
jgi:hypothetical protein